MEALVGVIIQNIIQNNETGIYVIQVRLLFDQKIILKYYSLTMSFIFVVAEMARDGTLPWMIEGGFGHDVCRATA